ncbi:transporter substrate-binding domain-containing protein [Vibrio paucivorans]|uniref:Transporter substrate-binding domain-containing protein n=1 Tax=Vibrio paucivorans TaxID=2829489 RepID=A0A9X3CB14_9VIBR|nr:transporter substrate-binding domain-containing protein [Vibrio paucivorans]MCW8332389.1 transporter substrate-binding domain-containing protein [Vibrio paucivorans]
MRLSGLKYLYFLMLWLPFYVFAESNKDRYSVVAIDYPPFTSPDLEDGGIAFRLLKEKLSHVDSSMLIPIFLPPKRALQTLENPGWCMSFYPPPKSQRSQFVSLSNQVVQLGLFRIKQTGVFSWQSLSEFSGQSVALIRTDLEGPFAKQFIQAGMEVMLVDNLEVGLELLLKQRVDYTFGDKQFLNEVQQSNPTKDLSSVEFSSTYILETQIGVYVEPRCQMLFTR